ncbi:MAG: signal peptidase I [Terracidiphilus sp.]|nr:signal peptidase I [Terracidiphilus sp.]MDR3775254.1 signal peptidase I [Terracidiphilus sp.]
MTKKNSPPEQPAPAPVEQIVEETPFEAVASICSVLVVGLFILTFLAQNFVIPSGSMEKTLLVGDHLVVDRITLAPPAKWMPLVHYREPKRGDIVVFLKPGEPDLFLVKRLVGIPGDHIHLRNGIVIINGVAQSEPHAEQVTAENHQDFLDEFPSVPPFPTTGGATETWAVDFPNHIENGELVVPPGKFFMMGDHRHNSLDSRYWGFVPRENIVGRPLFNYWSFKTPEDQYEQVGLGNSVAWMGHVVLHFFTETRWTRTLNPVR